MSKKPTRDEIVEHIREYPYLTLVGQAEGLRKRGFKFRTQWLVDQVAEIRGEAKKVYKKKPKTEEVVDDKPIAGGFIEAPDKRRGKLTGRRFVFTSAQNNTYVHEGFLRALEAYCEDNGSQLVIGAFTYNKTGWQKITEDSAGVWYDPKIVKYMKSETLEVTDDLLWCGGLDILPTAANPLNGLESYSRASSGIVPHAKVQMKSVPTMKFQDAKFLYATGTVTQRNYIERKAGQVAEFHHVFGALAVEIDDDGDWFARQLVADNKGTFYDLNKVYWLDGSVDQATVVAINWGDIHVEKLDEQAYKGCFGYGGIARHLEPRYQLIHDVADFSARNHHNIGDPYFLAEQHHKGKDRVEGGLQQVAAFLATVARFAPQTIVVESNHDQAFKKWLQTADARFDPANASYWHYWNYRTHEAIARKDSEFFVFEAAVREIADRACLKLPGVQFLKEDDSFVLCPESGGIECGLHGHRGASGSRGSPAQFRKLDTKVNTGHTHSAGILDGVYTAGVLAELDMGYNVGPSAWSHSHIVTYNNGKRAIVTQRGKKWRA